MELLILLVVAVVVGTPVAALVALAKARAAVARLEMLEARLVQLETHRGTIDQAEEPGEQRAEGFAAPAAEIEPVRTAPAADAAVSTDAPWLPPQPAVVLSETLTETSKPDRPAVEAVVPPPPFLPPPPVEPARAAAYADPLARLQAAINWEQFMGVKLFAWLGGLALFLSVAYFVKYSFEHNLVPPEVRVALGFALGLGLVIGGVRLRRREYRVTSQTLCATGVLILYAVSFACHGVYHFPLFGPTATFLLMALITAAAFLLAVRLDALVVATLGLLGGFLTPILLSTGEDRAVALFTYVALLDLGLLAVVLYRGWQFLAGLSALGTALMQVGWAAQFFGPANAVTAVVILLAFDALYLGAAAWARRSQRVEPWLTGSAAGLAFVSLAFCLHMVMGYRDLALRPWVVFGLGFGADLCLLGLVFVRPTLRALQVVGGLLLCFLLVLWTALHVEASLLGWALALYFVWAMLHAVFPLVLQRVTGRGTPVAWLNACAPLALGLVMIPLLKLDTVSLGVWPVVLLIDGLAVVLALVTGSILALAGVMLLTLVNLLVWMLRTPADLLGIPTFLILVGLFSAGFFAGSWWVVKWLAARKPGGPWSQGEMLPSSIPWEPAVVQAQLPAMAAVFPFVLLIVLLQRLDLANPSPVFGLGFLLLVLLLGLSRVLALGVLPAVGLGCALALEYSWHFRSFSAASSAPLSLLWYLAFAALFVVFPFFFRRLFAGQVIPWATAALAGPLHFYLVYRVVGVAYPNHYMGLLPALFAIPMLLCLRVLVKEFPPDHAGRNAVLALFGGSALFFITLVFPIQFERQWLTVAWALEGVALCWLYHRIPHPGLRLVGVALLSIAYLRLALNPAVLSYHPRASSALFNWYLYAYLIAAAGQFAAARLLAPPRNVVLGRNAPPLLMGMGTLLLFLLVNLEIADYFTPEGQATLAFQFGGNFGRDMSYTMAWALFALVLVTTGLMRQSRGARYAGLALLALTLLKLFFHDLAELRQLYRIGALAGVAVVAIIASFLYQRFLSSPSSADETKPPA
jgi:uncharacterized membrane protein